MRWLTLTLTLCLGALTALPQRSWAQASAGCVCSICGETVPTVCGSAAWNNHICTRHAAQFARECAGLQGPSPASADPRSAAVQGAAQAMGQALQAGGSARAEQSAGAAANGRRVEEEQEREAARVQQGLRRRAKANSAPATQLPAPAPFAQQMLPPPPRPPPPADPAPRLDAAATSPLGRAEDKAGPGQSTRTVACEGVAFICHVAVCGGTSAHSVCCPAGYPLLNECDCQCYPRGASIDCEHGFAACQYTAEAR
jgi:hypothetical protein